MLLGGEAFAWCPWVGRRGIAGGGMGNTEEEGGNGLSLVNEKGQWHAEDEVWGLLELVWPKPGTSSSYFDYSSINLLFILPSPFQPSIMFLYPPRTKPSVPQANSNLTLDLLILGLGPSMHPLSPQTRQYINSLGIRVDIQDTRNAAAQFNLLATERGTQSVAAALVPIGWREGRGVR